MKKITLTVSNCSVGQWSTLLLELNLIKKSWKKFGPQIQLEASSLKHILTAGTKRHEPRSKRQAFKKPHSSDRAQLEI